MNTMKYKDFLGSVEVSIPDDCIYGKILHINDLVTYEAETPLALKKAFRDAVDDYLETCEELGIEPHKSYSGVFNVRIEPEAHRKLASLAIQKNKKLNTIVKEAIEKYIEDASQLNEVNNNYYFTVMESSMEGFIPKNIARKPDIVKFGAKMN